MSGGVVVAVVGNSGVDAAGVTKEDAGRRREQDFTAGDRRTAPFVATATTAAWMLVGKCPAVVGRETSRNSAGIRTNDRDERTRAGSRDSTAPEEMITNPMPRRRVLLFWNSVGYGTPNAARGDYVKAGDLGSWGFGSLPFRRHPCARSSVAALELRP